VERFNLTTWFVDRHLDEGRGDRLALLCGDRRVTYAELAALVNRAGNVLRDLGVRQEERVLLALSDGIEFVATWYAAQKIGAVTAEVYAFLPAKDFACYLDYTRAGVVVVDATTLERMREARADRRDRRWPRTLLAVGVPAGLLLGGWWGVGRMRRRRIAV
jgi:acyl-coenzyme A synthetase/AMP-(fatty) acid ligase